MRSAGPPLPILALLAGGRGTRLAPLTEKIPKSMVEVAGEPFIAHQLRGYKGEGVRRVVICAGILAEQIEAYLGDGSRFGLEVAFSLDGPKPLGTGGALRKALPLLDDYFLVTYGDNLLDVRIPAMVGAFLAADKPGLMTVFRNENQWDRSNVEFADGVIHRHDKAHPTLAMAHIDYGMGILRGEVLAERPAETPFDLADVYKKLAGQGALAGFEVSRRFYEIGSPEGLAETEQFLQGENSTDP